MQHEQISTMASLDYLSLPSHKRTRDTTDTRLWTTSALFQSLTLIRSTSSNNRRQEKTEQVFPSFYLRNIANDINTCLVISETDEDDVSLVDPHLNESHKSTFIHTHQSAHCQIILLWRFTVSSLWMIIIAMLRRHCGGLSVWSKNEFQ